jgi:protocatechuate 3,4-dioxygenase beta subunit
LLALRDRGEEAPGALALHGKVSVTGKVVGPDGKPVPKARLFIFDSQEWKTAPQGEANGDGGFAFVLPPLAARRSYRYLVATAPDLGLGCDWVGVAAATEPLRDAVLRLPKDLPVRGRVVDLEGKPVAGARVRVTDLETGRDDTLNDFVRLWSKDRESQQQAVRTLGKRLYAKEATAGHFLATTDADGRFTLAGIGRDRCPQLTVSARGKASQVCLVPILPDFKPFPGSLTGSPVLGPDFTLPLAPSVPVTGVVHDATTGKPLVGVRVFGQPDLTDDRSIGGYLVLPEVAAVTDPQGRYTLDGLPKAKKYVLLADPGPGDGPTHLFVTRGSDAPGLAPVTADFNLPRGVVLTGRITDRKTGQPVRAYLFYRPLWSNKWVEEHPDYNSPGIAPWYHEASVWTDAEGRYKLTALAGPGILHVQVLGHDLERDYLLAKLDPRDDTEEVISKAFGLMKTFKTGGQGGGFGPMNLNAYRVLRIPEDARSLSADVTVAAGVKRLVKVAGPDGKPVSGAWVLNDQPYGGFSKPLAGAEFTAYGLDPDAPRRLYAQHDSRSLIGVLTLDGKETGPAVLKLEPAATVTGRVVDRDAKPLKDFRVSASYDDPEIGILLNTRQLNNTTPVRTDAAGHFTLPNIPPGLAVQFDAQKKGGGSLGHRTRKQTLKAGQTLDLGDWKPQ